MVWIMRLKSQPETLASLVIMWGSIPFNVAQNDVRSEITKLPLLLSTKSSTAETRCDARSTSVEKGCVWTVDRYWTVNGKQRWFRLGLGLVGRMCRALIPLHLPIQKEEKISPSRSSAPKAPVMAPSSVWIRLRSSASSSPAWLS